jgi:pimeloyl-ACP methyl ester carboxylesterase
MRGKFLLPIVSVLTITAVACGSSDSSGSTEPASSAATVTSEVETTDTSTTTSMESGNIGSISWDSCGDGLECGTLDVPIDYADPSGATTSIYMVRHLALDPSNRIGTLLVNPGGPGFGGSWLAESAEQIYSSTILDRFDILGFDPRGTGMSTPAIDCTDDYDYYFAGGDVTPDTPEERQETIDSTKEFTDECFAKSGDILPYVGTNNVARDMDRIRQALGEDKISYFGFSYGSELGATWTTLFPDTVRAAVLDGAADPNADSIEGVLQQNRGFESALDTFLAQCAENTSCVFHNGGNAPGAFDALMNKLDENPIPTTTGRPDLTRGMAITGVIQAMYDDAYWPELEQALADAAAGDGNGLLSLFDEYFQRQPDGTYTNDLEAFLNILCADDPTRMTIEEADQYVPQYNEAGPRLSPGTTGDYTCTFWPEALDPRVDITGAGAGPILVIGTTGDPATPLDSTRKMAATLEDGRLVVATANQHIGYNTSLCVNDAVDGYLVDLVAPDEELTCE